MQDYITQEHVKICNQAKSADNDNRWATLPCAKQLRNSKSIQSHEQTQHSIKKLNTNHNFVVIPGLCS